MRRSVVGVNGTPAGCRFVAFVRRPLALRSRAIDPSGTPAYDTGGPAKGSGFREAVEKDGIAVSAYGATDWSEAWAEAYALYLSSPEVLKSLRPATFAYLKGALP